MKPTKKQILKWTKALRSGKYKQTKGVLQDEKGYCCLGVACDVFTDRKNLKYKILEDGSKAIAGELPEDQDVAPKWLVDINNEFSKIGPSLSTLNDEGLGYPYKEKNGLNFNEIADLLEAVYVHGALD